MQVAVRGFRYSRIKRNSLGEGGRGGRNIPDVQVICTIAMISVRLPSSILRKSDAWIGLCRAQCGTPSLKGCVSWNRYLYLFSAKLNASNYKTLLCNFFSLRLSELLISPEYILPFSITLKSNISSNKSTKKTAKSRRQRAL